MANNDNSIEVLSGVDEEADAIVMEMLRSAPADALQKQVP